ncbi:MAG: DUF4345 domain-containing protein [Marivita sp.]|uniref:DUF4345 domain-containing protein n=1 Tax=Marivita sp. TaxID=2003365 RepID=UPI001B12BCB2|nr:DUF4345 domain-containing protein [Marivita sp.]MBO6883129.1 DUF4345 domain-containing protein [Marivita sp.]
MSLTRLQKTALAVAGSTSLGIGATILGAPHVFYASYGIAIGTDPSLLSEVRALGAGLTGFGLVMLAGTVFAVLRQAAVTAALTVFLAFPAGRLVSLFTDGVPSSGILSALGFELAIAALCLFAFRRTATASTQMAVS